MLMKWPAIVNSCEIGFIMGSFKMGTPIYPHLPVAMKILLHGRLLEQKKKGSAVYISSHIL